MLDALIVALMLLSVLVAASPLVLGVGGSLWDYHVRPRFIPREEIERLADEIMARYPGDPERAALREEEHHWFRSDDFERGKWRRVRMAIRDRREPPR